MINKNVENFIDIATIFNNALPCNVLSTPYFKGIPGMKFRLAANKVQITQPVRDLNDVIDDFDDRTNGDMLTCLKLAKEGSDLALHTAVDCFVPLLKVYSVLAFIEDTSEAIISVKQGYDGILLAIINMPDAYLSDIHDAMRHIESAMIFFIKLRAA